MAHRPKSVAKGTIAKKRDVFKPRVKLDPSQVVDLRGVKPKRPGGKGPKKA